MSRSRIISSLAAAALGISLFGACSAESLTERAVEFGLEQAIEGNEDLNIDLDGDGAGGFSISTDEGDFAINFDQENGGISFNSDEGEGTISFGENGIVYDTDEGSGIINFDEENGAINFQTDEGDGSIQIDEESGTVNFQTDEGDGVIQFAEQDGDGAMTLQTDDGNVSILGSTDIPASWPAGIGVPATGTQNFSVMNMGDDGTLVTGAFEHDNNDPFASQTVAALQAAGWNADLINDANGTVFAMLSKGNQIIQIAGDSGTTSVTIVEQ